MMEKIANYDSVVGGVGLICLFLVITNYKPKGKCSWMLTNISLTLALLSLGLYVLHKMIDARLGFASNPTLEISLFIISAISGFVSGILILIARFL